MGSWVPRSGPSTRTGCRNRPLRSRPSTRTSAGPLWGIQSVARGTRTACSTVTCSPDLGPLSRRAAGRGQRPPPGGPLRAELGGARGLRRQAARGGESPALSGAEGEAGVSGRAASVLSQPHRGHRWRVSTSVAVHRLISTAASTGPPPCSAHWGHPTMLPPWGHARCRPVRRRPCPGRRK
jgi:hypothetical protein